MRLLVLDVISLSNTITEVAYIVFDTQSKQVLDQDTTTDGKHFDNLVNAITTCDVIASHGATKDQKLLARIVPADFKPWVDTTLLPWGTKPKALVKMCAKLGAKYLEPFNALNQCHNLIACLLKFDIDTLIGMLLLNVKVKN
jgi:hypothetical protein